MAPPVKDPKEGNAGNDPTREFIESGTICKRKSTRMEPTRKSLTRDLYEGNSFSFMYSAAPPNADTTTPPRSIPYIYVEFIRKVSVATQEKPYSVSTSSSANDKRSSSFSKLSNSSNGSGAEDSSITISSGYLSSVTTGGLMLFLSAS